MVRHPLQVLWERTGENQVSESDITGAPARPRGSGSMLPAQMGVTTHTIIGPGPRMPDEAYTDPSQAELDFLRLHFGSLLDQEISRMSFQAFQLGCISPPTSTKQNESAGTGGSTVRSSDIEALAIGLSSGHLHDLSTWEPRSAPSLDLWRFNIPSHIWNRMYRGDWSCASPGLP